MLEHTQLEYEVAEDDYLSVLKDLKRRLDWSIENNKLNEEKTERRKSELAHLFAYHKVARSIINAQAKEIEEAYKRGFQRGQELRTEKTDRTPSAWRSLMSLIGHDGVAKLLATDLQLYLLNPKTNSKEAKRKASIAKAKQDFPHLFQSA